MYSKFKSDLTSNETIDELQNRITPHLKNAGYDLDIIDDESMLFYRGELLSQLTSMSPKGNLVSVSVDFNEINNGTIQITTGFMISTWGLGFTKKERQFWKQEIKDFENLIATGISNTEISEDINLSAIAEFGKMRIIIIILSPILTWIAFLILWPEVLSCILGPLAGLYVPFIIYKIKGKL